MESKDQQFDLINLIDKDHLKEAVSNRILVVTALFAVIALGSAQIRAFTMGWHFRDILQLVIVSITLIFTLIRKQLSMRQKALILFLFFSIGGFSGFYSLGMLAGSVFFFPAAIVISAVFYSARTTLIFLFAFLVLFVIVAVKFCWNIETSAFNANTLISSYFQWFAYTMSVSLFFAVAAVTIHSYRNAMNGLFSKINHQRDELLKANQKHIEDVKNIKRLSGLLPICAYCKKIRNDKGYWEQLEIYISEHSEADFSHSICDNCFNSNFKEDED